MSGKLIKSKIKLTIGMLVSNRISYIRNTMESLQPLLTAIPSELIVVDTKGKETDGSIDIVREYTDKIYPFTWCNDFSAARNVCLDRAKGEWFLYIDDDEWFDDVTEMIEFFQSGEHEKYNMACYYTHDYSVHGTYSIGIASRMIRRRENTRFQGKVHEMFNEAFQPIKQFSCFTHHYGYVFKELEDAKKHQERNISILQQELKQIGYTPKLCAQMVQELLYLEDTDEEGFHFAINALQQIKGINSLKDSYFQWIIASTVRYFARRNDLQGAKKQLAYVEETYELSEMTKLVLAGTLANIASYVQALEDMYHYASLYLKQWDWKQEHEKEAMLQVNLDVPNFYGERYYYQMVCVAAVAANHLKLYGEASKLWKRIPEEKLYLYQEELNRTIRGLQEEKDKQYDEKVENLRPLLDVLVEASEQVKLNFSVGNIEIAKGFLIAMQQTAITLGTKVDSLIGEDSTTVKLLEQYCELLWNCNNTQNRYDGLALAEMICEAIGLIQKNFLREVRRKRTILLFPSKAEDWLLFEPYWKKAKQDEDNVYIIPIPYFEKKEDGSFGKEYYEGESFSEDILITKYTDYHYHNKLADVIIVKENYNNKQEFYSVHPFYYIDNLKEYAKEVQVISEVENSKIL